MLINILTNNVLLNDAESNFAKTGAVFKTYDPVR